MRTHFFPGKDISFMKKKSLSICQRPVLLLSLSNSMSSTTRIASVLSTISRCFWRTERCHGMLWCSSQPRFVDILRLHAFLFKHLLIYISRFPLTLCSSRCRVWSWNESSHVKTNQAPKKFFMDCTNQSFIERFPFDKIYSWTRTELKNSLKQLRLDTWTRNETTWRYWMIKLWPCFF